MEYKLLIINPGSTSTKISLFADEKELFCRSRFHDAPVLLQYPLVNDQVPFRYQVILEMLEQEGVDPSEIDVFVGRGGSACTFFSLPQLLRCRSRRGRWISRSRLPSPTSASLRTAPRSW